MKRLVCGVLGVFIFYQLVEAHQFRAYCYNGGYPGANPLECYKVWAFDENTITWDNRPQPGVLIATVNSVAFNYWYTFSSSQLDQYIDSCVQYQQPICFRVKRQIQSGQSQTVWLFYEKETGSPPCELVYDSQTYTPPSHDARVSESQPTTNLNATFLWACNFDSPQRQEFFVRFDPPAGVEEGFGKEIRFLRGTPSPFSYFTRISYNLLSEDAGKPIVLAVYDVAGNLVKNLVNRTEMPGYHEVVWEGKDENGNPVPPGCYFYRLKVGELTLTTKGLLLR